MSEEWVDRLREHTDSLVVQQRLSCDYCGLIEFTSLSQLENHQVRCPMKPSVAKESNSTYDPLSAGLTKFATAEASKPLNYTCSKCGISFSSVDLREIHHRVFHQAEEPLQQNLYHTDHYKIGDKDLYAHLLESFGLESWLRHVEMECIQYLERARHKGSYREDIEKVKRICERILVETGEKL